MNTHNERWMRKYNQGREDAATGKGYDLTKGAAHFLGWSEIVGVVPLYEFKGDEWSYITDSQDITATLDAAALTSKQFPYWTRFDNWEDVTAIMARVGEGEYIELWATNSSTPYRDNTPFYPLPVAITGGREYHAYRMLRHAYDMLEYTDIHDEFFSTMLSTLQKPEDNPNVKAFCEGLEYKKMQQVRQRETRGRVTGTHWTYSR